MKNIPLAAGILFLVVGGFLIWQRGDTGIALPAFTQQDATSLSGEINANDEKLATETRPSAMLGKKSLTEADFFTFGSYHLVGNPELGRQQLLQGKDVRIADVQHLLGVPTYMAVGIISVIDTTALVYTYSSGKDFAYSGIYRINLSSLATSTSSVIEKYAMRYVPWYRSPDGTHLVSVDYDGQKLYVVDLMSEKVTTLRTLSPEGTETFSSDGGPVIGCDEGMEGSVCVRVSWIDNKHVEAYIYRTKNPLDTEADTNIPLSRKEILSL